MRVGASRSTCWPKRISMPMRPRARLKKTRGNRSRDTRRKPRATDTSTVSFALARTRRAICGNEVSAIQPQRCAAPSRRTQYQVRPGPGPLPASFLIAASGKAFAIRKGVWSGFRRAELPSRRSLLAEIGCHPWRVCRQSFAGVRRPRPGAAWSTGIAYAFPCDAGFDSGDRRFAVRTCGAGAGNRTCARSHARRPR